MNRIAQYLIAASLTLSVVACATDSMHTARP